MTKFKHYIRSPIDEASYMGNLGFEEMVRFYQIADEAQIKEMENLIKHADWEGFKRLIYKVIGVRLQ